MVALWKRGDVLLFLLEIPLHWQKGVQILEPQLCKDINTVKNMRMLLMKKRWGICSATPRAKNKKVLMPIKFNFSCLYHFSCIARIRLKKGFCWLACMNVIKKMLNKINLSAPLKRKMSPKILAKGTNCPLVIKS